jgi:multisubunit Na+/H+ antiporter MnhG subunit
MEIIFEVIFQFLGELVLQVVFEILAELGLHSVREVFKRPPNPVIATIGYAIYGAIAGGLSLWWHSGHFTKTTAMRIAVLVLVPLLSGVAMSILGAWRRRRDQSIIRLDRFAYGYVFALAMASVRFIWGH